MKHTNDTLNPDWAAFDADWDDVECSDCKGVGDCETCPYDEEENS